MRAEDGISGWISGMKHVMLSLSGRPTSEPQPCATLFNPSDLVEYLPYNHALPG
jgi:hypothetical protein